MTTSRTRSRSIPKSGVIDRSRREFAIIYPAYGKNCSEAGPPRILVHSPIGALRDCLRWTPGGRAWQRLQRPLADSVYIASHAGFSRLRRVQHSPPPFSAVLTVFTLAATQRRPY